jgi:hypothetical protein
MFLLWLFFGLFGKPEIGVQVLYGRCARMGAVWEMCKNGEELEAAPKTRRRAAPGRLGGEAGERMPKSAKFNLGTT